MPELLSTETLNNQSPTVLAVDPGAREIGFAVLNNAELIYYGIKTVRERKIPERATETASGFIRKMIAEYQPSVLAIETMSSAQKDSALLADVTEHIKAAARSSGLLICEYAPSNVRQLLCRTRRATRREAARVLSDRFSELARYFKRTRQWELDYYANLFGAVAVGAICYEEVRERKRNELC